MKHGRAGFPPFQSPVCFKAFIHVSVPAGYYFQLPVFLNVLKAHSWVCLGRRWGFWTFQCCRPASASLWLLERGKAMLLAGYFGLCIFWTELFLWCLVLLMVLEHLLMLIEHYLMNYSISKMLLKLWKGFCMFFKVVFLSRWNVNRRWNQK